jgi:hypothetical protein
MTISIITPCIKPLCAERGNNRKGTTLKTSKKKAVKKAVGQKNHNTNRTYMPRVRKELVDSDYLKDLPPKERAYMDKFLGEYYGANLNFKEPRKNLHKSKARRKDCTDRNNKQNNDLYGVTNANGLLDKDAVYKFQEGVEYIHPGNKTNMSATEDAMIEYLDNKDLLMYDEKELEIIMDNCEFNSDEDGIKKP